MDSTKGDESGSQQLHTGFPIHRIKPPTPMHRIDHIGGNPTKSENKELTFGVGGGKKKSGSTIITCPQS